MFQLTPWQRVRRKIVNTIPIGVDALSLEKGALSITFDDFPRNAWQIGGEILDKNGVRGTYYMSGGFCGKSYNGLSYFDADDLLAINASGHELGCHTFDHVSALASNQALIVESIAKNQSFLRRILPNYPMHTFAYPFGNASLSAKLHLRKTFRASRGTRPGLNRSRTEFTNLRAFPLEEGQRDSFDLPRAIKAAANAKCWMIIFTHDVSTSPSPCGCKPADLEWLIRLAKDEGLNIAPVAEVLTAAAALSKSPAA